MKRPKEEIGFNTATHSDTHQQRSFKQDLYFPLQVFPFCFLTLAKLMQTLFGITQANELKYLKLSFIFFFFFRQKRRNSEVHEESMSLSSFPHTTLAS